jgi:hypothetical protein
VEESDDIAFGVNVGMSERISHACLCGQMHYSLEPTLIEKFPHVLTVREIAPNKTEAG